MNAVFERFTRGEKANHELAFFSPGHLVVQEAARCSRITTMVNFSANPGLRLRSALWALLLLFGGLMVARAADNFLEPEKAFQFAARMVSADTAEVSFEVAKGYYLYREQFAFEAEGATLGATQIPPGKVKFDENFQKNVETHRDSLRIRVAVTSASGPFNLKVTSQGCADAGLCYPPMASLARLDPATWTPANESPSAPQADADKSLMDGALRSGRFWQVVGVFLGMGVLLSLTPCVLPMLPILSAILAGSQQTPTRLRGLALAGAYSLGMALVYTALGVAAGLAGEGLAAALQTPMVLGAFGLLLALFALSMFDVYELRLPARFTSGMSQTSQRLPAGRVAGVFAMGALSALIVSPCVSAPLAGALLYIGQSRDVTLGGAALFAMACGMSVPLLLLGVSAGRWLPRTGPWMNAIKRLVGVSMLAVAIWIVQPVLPDQAVLSLWGMLLTMCGFMLRPFQESGTRQHALRQWVQRALGVAALSFGVAEFVGAASGGRDPLQPLAHLGSTRMAAAAGAGPEFRRVRSVEELDTILAQAGRPVVLDFYADWCVSCKEMERFTFSQPEIAHRLSKAVLLKADVTANSEQDKALLRRFKLFGPPGSIFFDANGHEITQARVIGFQSATRFAQTLSLAKL